ncbi:hypothetical protein QCA50_010600 [Cerrena zonata]|uniref:Uncharacterized protein n=1 Tax=Cerrena zonata TaxID=2478898 RepID=A0AAW0FZE6_9APHY
MILEYECCWAECRRLFYPSQSLPETCSEECRRRYQERRRKWLDSLTEAQRNQYGFSPTEDSKEPDRQPIPTIPQAHPVPPPRASPVSLPSVGLANLPSPRRRPLPSIPPASPNNPTYQHNGYTRLHLEENNFYAAQAHAFYPSCIPFIPSTTGGPVHAATSRSKEPQAARRG